MCRRTAEAILATTESAKICLLVITDGMRMVNIHRAKGSGPRLYGWLWCIIYNFKKPHAKEAPLFSQEIQVGGGGGKCQKQ